MELNIKEFVKLSEREIHSDLNELFHFNDDSDGSVQSSEVLNSYYPVKPRKSQKKEADFRYEDINNNGKELNNDLVDEALAFIKAVQSNRKEIFDAEQQREELEFLNKSLESHTSQWSGFYNQSKLEVDTYFRILQAFFIRSLKAIYHNKAFFNALSRVQEYFDRQLPSLFSAPNDGMNVRLFSVKLAFNGKEKVIYIRTGLTLSTPFGIGKISDFSNDLQAVIIELSFGKLHSPLLQVLSWICKTELDCYPKSFFVSQQNFKISELFSFPSGNEVPAIIDYPKGIIQKDMDLDTELSENEESNANEESTESQLDKENNKFMKDSLSAPNRLFEYSLNNIRNSFAQKLLLGLAPKDSLPQLCKNLDAYSIGNCGSDAVDFDFNALLSSNRGRFINQEKELNTADIMSLVDQQNAAMKSLFEKQRFLIEKLEKVRHEGAKLSSLISNIRLAMFTRRIAHRNLLQAKGIPTNLFAASSGTRLPPRSTGVINSRTSMEQKTEALLNKASSKMTRTKAKDFDEGLGEVDEAVKIEDKSDTFTDTKKRVREDEKDSDNDSIVDDSTAGGKRKSRRKRY